MSTITVNGVRLYYELTGNGTIPLVLVHGSLGSHATWDPVAPALAESFRVLTYDRRGHSRSERPDGQGSVREDVTDLAALIEEFGLAPAYLVGLSFGGAIALRLAVARSDLTRGLIAHEPAMLSIVAGDPSVKPLLDETRRTIGSVLARIAEGDHAGAAEQFIETVAVGHGAWALLSTEYRQTLIENAPTFLDEMNDPSVRVFDLDLLREMHQPTLLTLGDRSPAVFAPVVRRLAIAMPSSEVLTFTGASHTPQASHPEKYVEAVEAFVDKHER